MADNKPELRRFRPLDPERAPSAGARPLSDRSDGGVAGTADDVRLFPSRRAVDRAMDACRRHYRNLMLICLGVLLHFVSLQGVSAGPLRSVWFGVMAVACLFLPTCLLHRFGCKWIAVCSMLPYAVYYATFLDPLLVPVRVAMQLVVYATAATLWVAVCAYVTRLAAAHAHASGDKERDVISRFFGIMFAFYQTGALLGTFFTSYAFYGLVPAENLQTDQTTCGALSCSAGRRSGWMRLDGLGIDDNNNANGSFDGESSFGGSLDGNSSLDSNSSFADIYNATANNLPDMPMSMASAASALDEPDDYAGLYPTTYILLGVYIVISIVAIFIVILFVDNDGGSVTDGDEAKGTVTTGSEKQTGCDVFLGTFRQWRYFDQILLIPLTIYNGMQQAFFQSTFMENYVRCSYGMQPITMLFVTFGLASAAGSLLFGFVGKYTGRVPIFMFGAVCHCAVQVALFLWIPSSGSVIPYFVISLFWGLGDAAWQTQIAALYGSAFRQRLAAFSNLRLWEALGCVLGYSYLAFAVCVYVQLYVLLSVLCVGMAAYFALEYRRRGYRAEYLHDGLH